MAKRTRSYVETDQGEYLEIHDRRSDVPGPKGKKAGPRGLGGPLPYESLILLPAQEFLLAYLSTHADAFKPDRKYWRVPKGVRLGAAFRARLVVPSDNTAPFVTFAEVLEKGQKQSAWIDASGRSTF